MGRSRPRKSLAEQIRNGVFQPEVDLHTGRSHPVRHSSDRRADPQQVCHRTRGIPPASSQREWVAVLTGIHHSVR